MTDWKTEQRICACGERFTPKREGQKHCSTRCRDLTKKRLKRSGDKALTLTPGPRSGDKGSTSLPTGLGDGPTMVWPERDDKPWPTPGALQGDDYPLEYYEDGYPKLPACLDRRPKPVLANAA